MMVKRLISALLALLLVLTAQPFSAAAAVQDTDSRNPVYIRVQGNTMRCIPVYEDHEDLLFSAQDLAELCAMELSWEGENVIFTRGSKTVKIDTKESSLYFMNQSKPIALPSKVYRQGHTYYISGAGVLPWLNVECTKMESGYLSFVPNAVSFWDHAQTLNLDGNMFRISDCAEILDMDTKDLKAIAYVEKNFSGTVTDYIGYLISGEAGYYDYRMYHDIFEDIVVDKSPIDESYNLMREAAEVLSEGSDVLSYFLKAAGIDGDMVGTAITYYSIWTKLECYRMLFEQDNSVKLEMIDSITSNNKFSANSDMKKAAGDVKKLCTERSEAFFKVVEDLAVDALQDVTTSTLLKAVKEDWFHIPNDRVTMERMSYYSDMISLGRAICSYGYGNATKQELTTYLSHAMMYLYAVEQSNYAMASYAADHGYDRETQTEFWRRGGDAAQKYSLILLMYSNLEWDACDPREKQKQTIDYYDTFASLDKIEAHTDATYALENAIYVTALKEFAPNALWTQADLDADGQPEILVQDMQSYRPEQLVVDGYTMDYFNSATAPAGDYEVVKTGENYFLYNAATDSYLRWNGSDWEMADSLGFFAGSMRVSGAQALTCPDLTDQTVVGNTSLLFDEIDTYFENRDDVWMQATQDLDGDGTEDRLVLLNGAANRYKQFLHLEGFENDLFTGSPLNYADRNVTLVTATTQDNGVRLRVCRIFLPYELISTMNPILRIEGRDLFIFGQQFRYREQGDPYSLTLSPEDPIAQAFLGIPRRDAETKLTDYNEWTGMGYGTATGYYQGVHLQLTYDYTTEETYGSPLAKVTSVSIFGKYKSMAQLVPYGIYLNMPTDEFYYQIPGIADWKPYPVMVTDYDGTTMWYNENYYHNEFSGDIYLMRLYFREKKDNTPLVIMDAIWQEDMSISDF